MATDNPMGLTIPTVSITTGPQYASRVNASLNTINQHDHSTGNGNLVPSAGIGIDADLPFNGFSPSGMASAKFQDQATPTSANGYFYMSGGDIYWYNITNATSVQITSGSSVVGAVGNITGLTTPAEADSTAQTGTSAQDGYFSWYQNKALGQFAKMLSGPVLIFDTASGVTNSVQLKSPASLPSSFAITLPSALPESTLPMNISATGVMTSAQVSTNQIADNSVTKIKQSALGQSSAVVTSYSNSTTSFTTIATISSLTSIGRPIMFVGTPTPSVGSGGFSVARTAQAASFKYQLVVTGTASQTIGPVTLSTTSGGATSVSCFWPASSLCFFMPLAAGTYTLELQGACGFGTSSESISMTGSTFYAYEL